SVRMGGIHKAKALAVRHEGQERVEHRRKAADLYDSERLGTWEDAWIAVLSVGYHHNSSGSDVKEKTLWPVTFGAGAIFGKTDLPEYASKVFRAASGRDSSKKGTKSAIPKVRKPITAVANIVGISCGI